MKHIPITIRGEANHQPARGAAGGYSAKLHNSTFVFLFEEFIIIISSSSIFTLL